MPILFLDFDGVLHPDCVYRVNGQIVLKRDGVALFEWAPILSDLLAPHPEIQIVLSTSWVSVLGFDATRQWLPPALAARVVGATYHSKIHHEWDESSRFQQIQRAAFRRKLSHWIAIDDDVKDWPDSHRDRLVAADGDLGLGWQKTADELRERLAWLAAGARP